LLGAESAQVFDVGSRTEQRFRLYEVRFGVADLALERGDLGVEQVCAAELAAVLGLLEERDRASQLRERLLRLASGSTPPRASSARIRRAPPRGCSLRSAQITCSSRASIRPGEVKGRRGFVSSPSIPSAR
jgi:hypothetical protein